MNFRYVYVPVVAALACSSLFGCNRSASATGGVAADAGPPPALKVETASVEIRKMPQYLTLTGTVIADRQSDVAANVSGRIISAPMERGQPVSQGQVLATVDARAAGFSAAAATAQAKGAESQEKLAQAECDRADSTFAKGAISRAEYDRLKTQCTAQVFTATAARANAELAAKQLGDTTIRAPFDGVVAERFINAGEYVQLQTKIATIVRIKPVRVQISVPESATRLIRQNDSLTVHVAAWGDRAFPATIRYMAPSLRAATRDLVVEAVAANTDGALRPGMFATASILIAEVDQPTVPESAVKLDGTTKRIFLARAGQAFEMVIRTGGTKDGWMTIMEPLTAADKVIVNPPPGLHDGVAVQ